MTPTSAVRARDLVVSPGGRVALRGVSLDVATGEVVALLGANGSGKSTLVRSLVRLVPLSAGSIELLGTPLATFSEWSRVGYVPQRTTATAGVPATVREVVSSGRLARSSWRPFRTADRTAVDDALEVVGLTDRRDDSVHELSGGQQQRVLIARALAGAPELLILDEPMAGVDLPSQDAFAATLSHLVRAGTTILLVAHELGPIEPLVDRAVVLRTGEVAYDGPPGLSAEPGHPWQHHVHHDDHHHPAEHVRPGLVS